MLCFPFRPTHLVLGDCRLLRFEELLQRPNFFPQLPDQRVGVGVNNGYGVDNLLGSLDVPIVSVHIITQGGREGRL